MLEVTILKTKHADKAMHGRDGEARKLIPFINNCDVFAPEEANISEDCAVHIEADWEKLFSMKFSRTAFLQNAEKRFSKLRSDYKFYMIKLHDYLFQSEKVIWYVERFSEDESNNLVKLKGKMDDGYKTSINNLMSGNIDEFLKHHWESAQEEARIVDIRDRHIGQNLSCAEEKIRERYEKLRSREPLRFAVQIGGMHKPEKYAVVPVNVRDLRGPPADIEDLRVRAFQEGKSFEEMKWYMLAYGVRAIAKYYRIASIGKFEFDDVHIKKMDFNSLSEAALALSKERSH